MAPTLLIVLLWCSIVSRYRVTPVPVGHHHHDAAFETSENPQQTDRFVEAVNEFALELYKKLAVSEKNVFFCPVCLYSSLALLEEVTHGKTRSELNATLRMKANKLQIDKIRLNLGDLNERIRATDCLFSSANGFFVDESCLVAFNSTMDQQEVYSTGVFGVDFRGNSQQAAWDMNEFVRSGTGANIKRVFDRVDESVTDAASVGPSLMLLNTLHFGADITSYSSVSNNRSSSRVKRTFFNHGVGDHDLNVPAIDSRQQKVRIAESYDFRALEVPCARDNSSEVSIWIFLSHKLGRLSDVEYGLSTDTFREVQNSFREVVTDICIPRIKFSFHAELTKDLRDLGLKRIFDPELAEFRMLPESNKGLRLTKVLHRASVDIGEQGGSATSPWTKAENATISSGYKNETSSSLPPATDDLQPFDANHPFLFFVMDKTTGIILYMGRLYEF